MRRVILTCVLAMAGCGGVPQPEATRAPPSSGYIPAAHNFGAYAPQAPRRSNSAIVQDILDLTFHMESGRDVPVMSRFEGPVTVRMVGDVPPSAPLDLARVVGRLRSEAGIDIAQTQSVDAAITIEFLPRHVMARIAPQAACFVTPRVSSWAEYRGNLRNGDADWTTLIQRTKAAIFIPSDTAPQEVRDCLNEELAQGLGPLNDLYRLPDSVFNDDNMQGLLTGFDMLVLRATYSPAMHSGMTDDEMAAALPGVLAAINPRGAHGSPGPASPATPRSFVTAIEGAIGPSTGTGGRRAAASQAVAIAQSEGWQDGRAGFAWLVLGRLLAGNDPSRALEALLQAGRIYRAAGMEIQAAHVDMQLAAFALSQGDAEGALTLTGAAIGPATAAQNAGLLSSLLMVRAEALDMAQRASEAQAVRMDSLAWARYGFGPDGVIRARLAEIAALSPARRSRL